MNFAERSSLIAPHMTSNQGRRRRALALVALLAAIAAGACSKSSSPTAPGTGGTPAPMSFGFGPFALGQSATLAFPTAGTFGYHCIPHRSMGMVGTVQVDAAGADSTVVQIAAAGLTFTPETAHVRPGGIVRWVNASGSTVHTVTSD